MTTKREWTPSALSVAVVFAIASYFSAAWAAPSVQNKPTVSVVLVNAKGEAVPVAWRKTSELIWSNDFLDDKEGPKPRPVFRTWLELPAGKSLASWSGNAAQIREGSGHLLAEAKGKVIFIDQDGPQATVTLKLKGESSPETAVSLVLATRSQVPWLLLSHSCREAGIDLKPLAIHSQFLFLGASCSPVGEDMEITIFRSADAEVKGVSAALHERKSGESGNGAGWKEYLMKSDSALKEPVPATVRFTHVGSGEAICEFRIDRNVHVTPVRRFTYLLGVGLTQVNYKEPTRGIDLQQLGVTPKAAISYSLMPGKWDLGASFFATAASISRSPESLEAARFLGANLRTGYHLPVHWWNANWSLQGGWYFWSMSNSYGINLLSGPQAMMGFQKETGPTRAYGAYLKVAPISNSLEAPSLSRIEIAVGGNYVFTRSSSGKSRAATLDFSSFKYSSTSVATEVSLFTATLGLQFQL